MSGVAFQAVRYRGLSIEPASGPPAGHGYGPSVVPGWQTTCPDCGWSTWGAYASRVREAVTGHRLNNWPPCERREARA